MDRDVILEKASKFRIEACILIATYIFLVFSAIASSKTGDGTWFSRSGSIAVLISAIIEFRNFSTQQVLNEIAQESTKYWDAKPEKYVVPENRKLFDRSVLVTIVIGTLIWGYGDLLF